MHVFHWKPEDWLNLTKQEKALIIAGIQFRTEEEKKAKEEAEKKARH